MRFAYERGMSLDKVVNPQGLRTFDGVFTPTVLTVLGVVMYLRLGWVVGNAGFVDTLAIILMAHAITICTALSMASMVSNIEIGAGGAYAIISRSLGFEIGGAIGIPLYFSQAFSVAFYIIGFVELWLSFFPTHSPTLIALVAWAVLAGVSIKSAQLAFRVQYVVLAAIAASLVSFLPGRRCRSSNRCGGARMLRLDSGKRLPSFFRRLPASWLASACRENCARRAAASSLAHCRPSPSVWPYMLRWLTGLPIRRRKAPCW
jgi:hypothetical protein